MAVAFPVQALLLGCFVFFASVTPLLARATRGSGTGFPFVPETVLTFPYLAQMGFYYAQLAHAQGGLAAGARCLWESASYGHLKPCITYSLLVAGASMLETKALGYLAASTVSVLKQTKLLGVTFFEAVLLGSVPTLTLLLLISVQCGAVFLFNLPDMEQAHNHLTGNAQHPMPESGETDVVSLGTALVLISVVLVASGVVLQQRYMQSLAQDVPVPAKLYYQHVVGFLMILSHLLGDPDSRLRLSSDGFFYGWTSATFAYSASLWICFMTASAVVAYVSAMAIAICIAVAMVFTGLGEHFFFGRFLSPMQEVLMIGICVNSMVITWHKANSHRRVNLKAATSAPSNVIIPWNKIDPEI